MNVKGILIEALKTKFHFPVFLQGSMSDDQEHPSNYFTFWNNGTQGDSYYSNKEARYIWDFDLFFYSDEPKTIDETMEQAIHELKQKGFIIDGLGFDVASSKETHTGRGLSLLFIEEKEY